MNGVTSFGIGGVLGRDGVALNDESGPGRGPDGVGTAVAVADPHRALARSGRAPHDSRPVGAKNRTFAR